MSKNTIDKKPAASIKKPNEDLDQKDEKRDQENLVLDTAGGEMPDPSRMPSESEFHSDEKQD